MAATNATSESETSSSADTYRLMTRGVYAVIAASAVNALVLFIALALFVVPSEHVGNPFGPLAVGPVVVNSAIAAIGATSVYGVVTRYSPRPNWTFTVFAGVVLMLSFGMFLTPNLSGAPLSVFAILGVMHVTTAVIVVAILIRATDERD